MKKIYFLLFTLMFIFNSISASTNTDYLQHTINASVDIASSTIAVSDTIYFPKPLESVRFYLNPNLKISFANGKLVELDDFTFGNKNYEVILPNGIEYLVLNFEGELSNNKELFVGSEKGKRVGTSGLIHEGGIYLSGSTYWIPSFEGFDLFTFQLTTHLPLSWKLVSQGQMISEIVNDTEKIVKYSSEYPNNQVYFVANKWTEYTRSISDIKISVFLINPDEALAQQYLGVTEKYMRMYNKMIGDYPYSKFDVVENFWETGFGMPSFTLLGQQVIRFPWILASSYPHEYLHNYWGNSVFVDYESGNWCEGLTTYMADYLIKEQSGEAAVYRRNMLKKYSDYVTNENEYAVSKFKSKVDEVSEAIGYGKVFMINHMLRKKYGAQKFVEAYADFYANNKFKIASFIDIQNSFEKITKDNLSDYFAQWINEVGSPAILLKNVSINKTEKKYNLSIHLEQTETEFPFVIEVPVFIYLENSEKVIRETILLNDWSTTAQFAYSEKPIRVDVDPEFDVMRRLDNKEVPTTLSGVLGDKNWLIVLPKSSPFYDEYKALANSWEKMYASNGKEIVIVDDNLLSELPEDKSVWLMGSKNLYNKEISVSGMYEGLLEPSMINQMNDMDKNGVFVYTFPNPKNDEQAIVYLNSSKADNIIKLTRKLMHYGSYSYLGFDAETLKNNLSGTFPVKKSPLSKIMGSDENIDWSIFSLPETDFLFQ